MSLDVWFHVVIPCESEARLREAAHLHLDRLGGPIADDAEDDDDDGADDGTNGLSVPEARWMLADFAGESRHFDGGHATWGLIGNYTQPKEVIVKLAPFLAEVLSPGARALFFYQVQESSTASCFEISRAAGDAHANGTVVGELIIRKHGELPFNLLAPP